MANYFSCVCLLLLVLVVAHHVNSNEVPFRPVVNAVERTAICMDGSPAGYHLDSGYGEGSKNWIVYLKGGGWCPDNEACQSNRSFIGSSRSFTTVNLTGILSPRKDINPGIATILHCDEFRRRLPFTSRVKCISDAGVFIRAKDLPNADYREGFFASTIMFHCLFSEYLVGGVQTPLFILNSAFDYFQLDNLLVPRDTPNLTNAPTSLKQLVKDFGMVFLNTIREIPDNPSRGLFIYPCLVHSVSTSASDKQSTIDAFWNPNSTIKLENMNILEAVSTWYFDRGTVKAISNADFPQC